MFPITLLLEGKSCLVVGGKTTALQRVNDLLGAGALVSVVASDITPELQSLPVSVQQRPFRSGDTSGFALVISATGDAEVDAAVHADGQATGTLVNAVDNPASCDFYVPAVVRRGLLNVAISTGGASPAIASWIRARLDDAIDEHFGEVVDLVAEARDQVRARGLSSEGLPWGELIEQLTSVLQKGGGRPQCHELTMLWLEAELGEPTPG